MGKLKTIKEVLKKAKEKGSSVKRIGDKAKVKPFVKGKLAPGTRSPASKKHGKVSQEQKDLAVLTGVVAAGTLAAAKAQSNRNKTGETKKGVGAAVRGFGKALR